MLPKLILGLVLVGTCQGVFENCDYYEELVPTNSYFLFSPEYPDKYPPGASCRWYLVSPPKTRISLVCEDFYVPHSKGCQLDRVGVSRGGHIDLRDVQYYCGKGKLEVVSDENRLNVLLLTVDYSPRGSFFCHIEVKKDDSPPQPPPNPNCSCGFTNPMRIVGGTETGVNEYPMMAGLIDGLKKQLFCGATIISQKFVVTAAHCLINRSPKNVAVLVGDHDISVGNDTDSAKLYLAEQFYTHPQYDSVDQKNDVALVRVRRDIQFSKQVGAVCLPFLNKGDTFAGETVHFLGWGRTEFGGPTSDKLLSAPVDVITLEQCKPAYGDLVTEKQICTYREDKDACQSDSGGPLLWRDSISGVVKIVGIISFGIQCATTNPSVNTRVTSYLDWIKDTTRCRPEIVESFKSWKKLEGQVDGEIRRQKQVSNPIPSKKDVGGSTKDVKYEGRFSKKANKT